MKGSAFLLLIALVLAVLAISGRVKCITQFIACFASGAGCSCNDGQKNISVPSLPKLEPLPQINVF